MDIYTTAALLLVVNRLVKFDPFLLNLFFPNAMNFDTKDIYIDQVGDNLRLAPFVSPMVAGKARTEEGIKTTVFQPGYLKPKAVVDPTRVLKRRAGEALGGAMSPEQRRQAAIRDILIENDKLIDHRLEWMAAQVLRTGTCVVIGDDYPAQLVDFGRDASLTKTLAGAARWGEAGVSPINDLETWASEAEAPITTVVMDQEAWKLFRTDPDVKELLDTRRGSNSQLELGPDNGRNFSFKGRIGADMEIWVYSGVYEDESGVTQKFLPDNTVIMGSPAIEGYRAFGAIMSPSAGYMAMERYPRHFITQDPELEFVETQSAPLIIPGRPNSTVAITVR